MGMELSRIQVENGGAEMDMDKSRPQIYGYIYEWGEGEDLPADAQEERIRQRAVEIDGRWVGCHSDTPVAGKTRPFHDRPEARKLGSSTSSFIATIG